MKRHQLLLCGLLFGVVILFSRIGYAHIPATQTLICPNCKEKYRFNTSSSGNNMGAVVFSDMKYLAPMMPDTIKIFKCSKCKQFVWVRDMEEGGKRLTIREGYAEGETMQPLSPQELAEALRANVTKKKYDERYLRFTLWWLFNDRIRDKKDAIPKESELWKDENEKRIWRENLDAILKLLDASNIEDQLLRAEIHREREEFDRAIAQLDNTIKLLERAAVLLDISYMFWSFVTGVRIDDEEVFDVIFIYKQFAQAIRQHCQERDYFVFAHYMLGRTPLHSVLYGPYHSDVAVVKYLIKHGADVNAKNKEGDTPLHEAASRWATIEVLNA